MRRFLVALLLVGCGGDSDSDVPASGGAAATGGSSTAGQGGEGGAAGSSGGTGGVGPGGSGAIGGVDAGGADAAPDVTALCPTPKPPGTSTVQVTSSGQQRSARLVIPQSYNAQAPVPLVMVFHGYTQTATQIENLSKMTPLAEQHGFVVVYPSGISNSWNAGKCCGTAASQNRPDVAFVNDLITALEQELCIDPKRIYAAGFSNGAMLTSRLACELSNRIAAFAPVSGPLAMDGCTPARPLAMLHFHGTSDMVVPYNGNGLGGALSFAAAMQFWKTNAACTDGSPTQVYSNGDSSCVEYQACQAGVAVRGCTVDGGGHQWPGGNSAPLGGKLTQDISASAEMVKFFLAHPL